MIGVGTDIVEISRIGQGVETGGDVFLDKTFTAAEQEAAGRHALPVSFYAKCFAAKEAVFKTLDTDWDSGIELHEIEILERDSGQPYVVLHGHAKRIADAAGATSIALSVSYDGEYAIAFAVAT
ncbi:MAG: holo-[acyl-carrier-protein] synthase [Actinobacteria bacterium HGW-Actinobacteria-1]|nr:MAG: holo-[acyl-carrier-protein] synthase [Actinobacteria bacterium HGW-Actinobacteria-1]